LSLKELLGASDPLGFSDPLGISDPLGVSDPLGFSDPLGISEPLGINDAPETEETHLGDSEPVAPSAKDCLRAAGDWSDCPNVASATDDLRAGRTKPGRDADEADALRALWPL